MQKRTSNASCAALSNTLFNYVILLVQIPLYGNAYSAVSVTTAALLMD